MHSRYRAPSKCSRASSTRVDEDHLEPQARSDGTVGAATLPDDVPTSCWRAHCGLAATGIDAAAALADLFLGLITDNRRTLWSPSELTVLPDGQPRRLRCSDV
jgi:hypothetical protein